MQKYPAMTNNASQPFRAVVGYDFSKQSDRALEQALWIASALPHAQIHLVAAVDKKHHHYMAPNVPDTFEGTEEVRARVLKEAEEMLESFSPKKVQLFVHTRIEDAADAILEVAVEVHADMIFVGPHSKTGIQRMFVGSVSEKVVKNSSCPVMVVRETKYDEESPGMGPEPPCPRCVKVRQETHGETWWCDLHDHKPPYESPMRSSHHDPEGSHHFIWPYHR